jgi:hypothetical protein
VGRGSQQATAGQPEGRKEQGKGSGAIKLFEWCICWARREFRTGVQKGHPAGLNGGGNSLTSRSMCHNPNTFRPCNNVMELLCVEEQMAKLVFINHAAHMSS